MNKRGFTLVEILAVLVIIGLITVLAVPAVNNANKKTKERILNTKITTAKQAVLSYAQDNENCFRSSGGINCVIGINNGCTQSGDIVSCSITFSGLVNNNLISYDKEIDGVKTVINPVDNSSMNNQIISFAYNKIKRTFSFSD